MINTVRDAERPTALQAERGAREFIEAVPFSQNVVDTSVADDAIDRPVNRMVGWSFWTWKKVIPARYPALVGVKATPDWTSVIQRISAP